MPTFFPAGSRTRNGSTARLNVLKSFTDIFRRREGRRKAVQDKGKCESGQGRMREVEEFAPRAKTRRPPLAFATGVLIETLKYERPITQRPPILNPTPTVKAKEPSSALSSASSKSSKC